MARREDGSIRPLSEILEAEHNAKFAARQAAILAKQETEAAKSETQKRVERVEHIYAEAKRNDDHARAKYFKSHLDTLKDQLASERAAEAKAKLFAGDRRITLIREEAELIERSGHTLLRHASQVERDNLVAIARSNDYPDPQSQFRDFKALSDRLTDAEIEHERVKASDAEIERNRQGLTAAESKVRTVELEAMRAKRENVE
jgi:hypothetical protein